MGLNASVMCNCFKQGRTTEPPFPRDWLVIDDEGRLSLRAEHDSIENSIKIDKWEQTCCEHLGMDYAFEYISNWVGYRLFQQALERAGWEDFPVLQSELPESNGGLMSASSVAIALQELDYFRRLGSVGLNARLLNTATGETIFEHFAAYEGVFILDGRSGVRVGIGQSGFFIQDQSTGADLFRATRFRQTLLGDRSQYQGREVGPVEYLNLDTGKTFRCQTVVHGKAIPWPDGRMQNDKGISCFECPSELHVEIRADRPNKFSPILEALSKVFRAAVETGNPVRWS